MDSEHGVAFLIAPIKRTKPSAHAARIMIEFESYAIGADAGEARSASFTDAVADAKRQLAESLGIASDKIEITIRL